MKYIFIFIFVLIFHNSIFASNNLLFKPLFANIFEPSLGMLYQTQPDRMRLDIGASYDIASVYKNETLQINTGVDFFTLTRLRSEGKLKFPVETTDFLFGINISGKLFNTLPLSSRLRIAHISSHLSDGYSDYKEFYMEAFVYSMEFIDLVVAYDFKNNQLFQNDEELRLYGGLNYVFSKLPTAIPTLTYQMGFDTEKKLLNKINLAAGLDFKYFDSNEINNNYSVNIELGPKFNFGKKPSIFLYINYFAGKSIHGLFYDDKDEYFGLGFKIIYY